MAEIKLTSSQQAVVENRGGALLVSAAAGSGKTKVLVERLMGMVCDPVNPKNINEFLIITYTKAAAAELRGKISAELGERLARQPGNRHLQRQMNLVYLAEISTVHAFCGNLLRNYAHILDIPADFRVAEEAECRFLRERCLEQILDEAYGHLEQNQDLRAMVDTLGFGRDDRGLNAAVVTLYDAALCHPYPEKWIDRCEAALGMGQYQDCAQTPWGTFLIQQFQAFLESQIAMMEKAVAEMAGCAPLEKSYLPCFSENIQQLRALLPLRQWDAVAAEIPTDFGRLTAVRNFEDKEFLERLKGVRSRCLEGLRDWAEVFYGSNSEVMADLAVSASALRGALQLVRRLRKSYAAEKRCRRIMDFGDLEHFAIRLLVNRETGCPTATAREVAARYAEIMVDEYQDSNAVQETIFAAISSEGKNRFLVGDVKQSIYRFRLADPSIFLEKYKSYHPYQMAAPGEPRKILLSENFRSHPGILAAVNHVFRTVMSEQVGDLYYGDNEALRAGLQFPEQNEPVVELHCIEPQQGDAENNPIDKGRTEAAFVAERIVQLLNGGHLETPNGLRPIRPEDIVILLRSVNSAASDYAAALHDRGIPCASDRGESILDTREVEVLLSVLQMIDNPHQDIPLVSALSSPIFQYTAEELAEIRSSSRSGDFYDAVCKDAERSEKSKRFLRTLSSLRSYARWAPLHALMRFVYEQTDIEDVFGAMEHGRKRRENLQSFFAYAVEYDLSGKVSLMEFLDDINRRRQQGFVLQSAGRHLSGAVQIMSIHKSKGLEFPVVFLADLSRRFNTDDLRQQVVTHPQLFAASNMIDWETGVRFPTVAKKAISLRMKQESLSEELRVLYVAMTRAKNRLIMTYCSRYLQSELKSIAAEASYPAQPDFAARARNPGWWVLIAAMCRTEAGVLAAYGGVSKEADVMEAPWKICLHTGLEESSAAVERKHLEERKSVSVPHMEVLRPQLQFCYPNFTASTVPSKVTATQLKGRQLDQEALERAVELLPHKGRVLKRPDFIMERRGLTPAEKGIANHLFLQFADYQKCTDMDGIASEVTRMLQAEFLTSEQAEAIKSEQIIRLFRSPLGFEILHSEQVVREMKFSILVDASNYFPSVHDEKIMLQGVVDCLLLSSDGISVIDFKTDALKKGEEQERAESYRNQLAAYALALSRIYQKPVIRRTLYFLTTGRTADL